MHSSRLKPLHFVARAREDGAVSRYVGAREELRRHEQKHAELEAYLAEYCRAPDAAQSATQLRMRRDFIERLRSVLGLQAVTVDRARATCEAQRAEWLLAHRNTEVLDQLATRYKSSEARVAEKKSQKETDEFAAIAWRRTRPT